MDLVPTKLDNENKIFLNGREVTLEELEAKREEVKTIAGAELIEVSPSNFKIRILG